MTTRVLSHGRLVWVNVERPDQKDMAYLAERFGFHPLDLEDCLSHIERPKIDDYDEYLFIVMHFPIYYADLNLTRPNSVNFFIGPNFLVTVHNGELKPMNRFWQICSEKIENREKWMNKNVGRLFYDILNQIVDYIFPMLDRIGKKISVVEENMFVGDMRNTLRQISLMRRDIIALRRILRAQIPLVRNLERKERPFIQDELDVYFGDISDAFARANDVVEDYREVIEGLSATADSVTTYRINEIIRTLTVISVIILPLTLVSGIYGMNVPLPILGSLVDFFIILGLMFVLIAGMLLYFRYRRWL